MWTPPGYPVDASIALPSHSGCQSEPCNGLNASRSRAEKRSISLESERSISRALDFSSPSPRLARRVAGLLITLRLIRCLPYERGTRKTTIVTDVLAF